MTVIDLRIKFKLETGDYPGWIDRAMWINNTYSRIKKLKSIYGFWLENRLGNSKELREEFYKEFSFFAKYEQSTRKANIILKQEYILWLEEKNIK